MSKSKSATAQRVKSPLKLAPVIAIRQSNPILDECAQDCVDELRALLRLAETGKLTGFVYAAMCPNETQIYDIRLEAMGEADRNPIFAIGMLSSLNHQLLQKVNDQ